MSQVDDLSMTPSLYFRIFSASYYRIGSFFSNHNNFKKSTLNINPDDMFIYNVLNFKYPGINSLQYFIFYVWLNQRYFTFCIYQGGATECKEIQNSIKIILFEKILVTIGKRVRLMSRDQQLLDPKINTLIYSRTRMTSCRRQGIVNSVTWPEEEAEEGTVMKVLCVNTFLYKIQRKLVQFSVSEGFIFKITIFAVQGLKIFDSNKY
ncbi:hypothetical protein KUTeg_024759 [Tegillarca granosa]|uniref:Uncharacterized protein n=1 Tax=Tegillarca granosa TaxID=220873 RepID=A0ABQ9E4I6_TEGGR|nr:hypothetical protein KUTeg_024759 [Tegillarca granosa]